MKVIFRLKPADYLDMEDCINLARNIKNTWDNMKDLDAMVISKDIEVYVADDDSKAEVILDGEQGSGEIDAEPMKHGYWIDVNYDGSLWRCSVCGETQCCKSNYCGDCGAKMDLEKENDTQI